MKRLLLFVLIYGGMALSARAQLSPIILDAGSPARHVSVKVPPISPFKAHHKTQLINAWYNFPASMNDSFQSVVNYTDYSYIEDSLSYFYSPGSPQYTVWNSLGAAFDPVDRIFNSDADPNTVTLLRATAYTWDSISIPYSYIRRRELYNGKAVVDTLIVQLFTNSRLDSTNAKWYIAKAPGDTARLIAVPFDIKTGIAKVPTRTIKYQLTDKDTTANEYSIKYIRLPVDLQAAAGDPIAAVYTYKAGVPVKKFDTLASSYQVVKAARPVNAFHSVFYYDYNNHTVHTYNNGMMVQYQQRHNATWLQNSKESARYLSGNAFSYTYYPGILFHVIIKTPLPGITDLVIPKMICSGDSFHPQIQIENKGTAPTGNMLVTLKVSNTQGDYDLQDSIKTSIASGSSYTFSFRQIVISDTGYFSLQASVPQGSPDVSPVRTLYVNALPNAQFNTIKTGDHSYRFTAVDTLQKSYSWDFGDGGSDTGFRVNHNYSLNGNFDVKLQVKNKNNCLVTSVFTVSPVGGIFSEDLPAAGLSVRPNPFSSFLDLKCILAKASFIKVLLVSMDGKQNVILEDGNALSGLHEYHIPLKNYCLTNSCYILRVVTAEGSTSKLLIRTEK